MTISAIFRWENQDSTSDFNTRFGVLFQKGVLSGGIISAVPSSLSVNISPFTILTDTGLLVVSDEIESVTEPGVAGRIISATAEFFIEKACFLVIATHLGQEIQKSLPNFARIDGIEARGLDEYYELIVDHNPVIGKLANSTPELIVEKMANTEKTPYLEYLYNKIKNK